MSLLILKLHSDAETAVCLTQIDFPQRIFPLPNLSVQIRELAVLLHQRSFSSLLPPPPPPPPPETQVHDTVRTLNVSVSP